MKPVVAVTVGDYNGIGPEVVLKAITSSAISTLCNPVLIGPWEVFRYYARRLKLRLPGLFFVETENEGMINVVPGELSAFAGRVASRSIEVAVRLTSNGLACAMVTAPVSKQALHMAGVRTSGQTELLQRLTGSRRVAMMVVSDTMRIGLVTIHIPIQRVAKVLSQKLVKDKIMTVHDALISKWRIRKPRLAVLALNPHAGEGGTIGTEEHRIINPVLRRMQARGVDIEGPFPADSFFGRYRKGSYDAVMAMYHDQGLIPLKMSSFGSGVNVSAGLPITRTSPDHGTGFDIAGKGIADPGSMIEAIRLAVALARNRGQQRIQR
jgi:4-hydroxythreonine-4-phosphate dehydrogenase